MLVILDKIAEGLLDNPIEFSSPNFGFTSKNRNNTQSNDTVISIPLMSERKGKENSNNRDKKDNQVKIEYSTNNKNLSATAQLVISSNIFTEIGINKANIYSYAFKNDGFFSQVEVNKTLQDSLQNKVSGKVDSFILATTIYNTTVTNLSVPIEITFQVNSKEENLLNEVCSFWQLSGILKNLFVSGRCNFSRDSLQNYRKKSKQ